MNFINKYINDEEAARYYYAEEFTEVESQVIFSVGEIYTQALITKADAAGNILWEKRYSLDGGRTSISFKKIIQLTYNPATKPVGVSDAAIDAALIDVIDAAGYNSQYILHATNGTEQWLMSINETGNVIWCRQIFWPDADIIFHLEPCAGDNSFYIVISDTGQADTVTDASLAKAGLSSIGFPFVAKFDANGSFLYGRLVIMNGGQFIVNAAKAYSGGIVLVGRNQGSAGLILDLDTALNQLAAKSINYPLLTLHDVMLDFDHNYILSGYLSQDQMLFVAQTYRRGPSRMIVFPGTANQNSKICAGAGGSFYFLQYNNQNGLVHKFDETNTREWLKFLDFDQKGTGNGVNFLNYNSLSDQLTFNAFNQVVQSLLVHTDATMDSCKTVEIEMPLLEETDCFLNLVEYAYKEQPLNIKDNAVNVIVNEPGKQELCPADDGGGVIIDENTAVQSPNFYLQSAGSTGADGSAKGIHVRWIFAGALGQKHLPKGNYAFNSFNFNKPDDFVKIFRAPYVKAQTVLSFETVPYLVDDANKVILYRVGSKVFYVYFRNTVKYSLVRASINPMISPLDFIKAYGSELIEIENKKELFFAAEIIVEVTSPTSSIKTETLSVAENALAVSRSISSRKTFTTAELGNIRLVCENGRSIRLKGQACVPTSIRFEFYTDFIIAANRNKAWKYIDKYALTLDTATAFTRLEPSAGLVDGKWQRFNDNARVNTLNYQNKWNGPRESWDRNIQMVVNKYIDLSNAQNNPRALENVPMQSGGPAANDVLELSNLDLLNIAAYDYHVARMLGLGTLDVSSPVMDGQYIYIAQYITKGDLEDGGGARTVNHLAMGIPVSINDQRLPLPINLKEIVPGAFWGSESPEPVNLTDANGYTHDGRARYVTLFSDQLPEDELNKPFYYSNRQFNTALFTYPVYAGLEYKKNNETEWVKPELPNDPKYLNRVDTGATPHNETIPLVLPESQKPLFIHKQRVSGLHYYSSYGINWFSRAASSALTLSIQTDIQPVNPLRPPSNINALLIREEKPLLLTSLEEQVERYASIPPAQDHTLIRLTFDYHYTQEVIDYKVPVGANVNDPNIIPADSTEIFADKVDIFFRNQVPGNVSGKALLISDHPSNTILSVIQTGKYVVTSTGEELLPVIPAGTAANYIGGVFIMGSQQFIIHQVVLPSGAMQGPEFTVYKKEISNGIVTDEIPAPGTQNLQSPEIIPDGLFMAVENMQNTSSWGTPNPLAVTVDIGTGWAVNREVITIINSDGSTEQHLEKARGIWDDADIEIVEEPVDNGSGGIIMVHKGLYKFTFQNVVLPQHAQYSVYTNHNNSVEWYQGIIRAHTYEQPSGERKVLRVVRIENIGTTNKLIIYALDSSFSPDPNSPTLQIGVQTGVQSVNFYPGYKVYLYTDAAAGLTWPNILPAAGEGVHYSIFGLRSHDLQGNFYSRISAPQLMFAQEQVAAIPPELPLGALYATRPDFFGRSTYTFKTKYAHKPHGVLSYRSNNEALLDALYEQTTVAQIKEHLKSLGGNDEAFLTNRWRNFFDFGALITNGDYLAFPPNDPQNGYKFPHPDKKALFDWANNILGRLGQPLIAEAPGVLPAGDVKIREFVKGAVFNAFVPLTEVPVIYQHINGTAYQPVGKKQMIRDRNGNVLKPSDPGFDMAPMMKVTGGAGNETSFTDFTLDGTSDNLYFYGVRELDTQMKMSDFSPFLGPVKLVNTNPPEAPEVKRIMPVLENTVLGISPHIQLEINAYPGIQHVKKINVYRALTQLDAQSVRTMKLVKVIDLETAGILAESVWQVEDGFEDLVEVPYGEGLFYRLTVSRRIEYADKDGNIFIEYAPSQPSKLAASMMVESSSPPTPVLTYVAAPVGLDGLLHSVMLNWSKTGYKCRYHIYKMNSAGNWVKIHELTSNNPTISVPLSATDLQSDTLTIFNADGNVIYHHFKVVAENTAGMLSIEENILTVPNDSDSDIGGVGDMEVGFTFIITGN
jgi:hypothetical protein